MTDNRPISADRFPPPHRAPVTLDSLAAELSDESLNTADPGQRRYQRAMEGWVATRIRKQSRHWRQR